MGKYNIGDVWWVHFPYSDKEKIKRRPAIIIDEDIIAIITMYVTTKNNENNPYSIAIEEWQEAGLKRKSWARIDRIVRLTEWNMDCRIGELSQRYFIKIIQLVEEIMTNKIHNFSILAIKNSEDKYLQIYDERWQSYLFPYVRSTDNNNKDNVDNFAKNILHTEVVTEYVNNAKHCKYSVSDNVYKIYNHNLYKLILHTIPDNMIEDSFVINGARCKWLSFEEMEKNERIMEVNDEIVAFVKKNLCV